MGNPTCDKCVSWNEIPKPQKDSTVVVFTIGFLIFLAVLVIYVGYLAYIKYNPVTLTLPSESFVLTMCAFILGCVFVFFLPTVGVPLWNRHVVGQYIYAWKDDISPEGYIHTHLTQPMQGWNKGCLLRLRIGGWFKTNRIYITENQISQGWQIIRCWNGEDIMIRDHRDEVYGTRHLTVLFELFQHASIADYLFEARIEVDRRNRMLQDIERIIILALLDQKNTGRSKAVAKMRGELIDLVVSNIGQMNALGQLTEIVRELVPEADLQQQVISNLTRQLQVA